MPIEVKKTAPSTAVKDDYRVLAELTHGGMIHGARRAVGDIISLTPAEAQWLVLDGVIEPVNPPQPDPGEPAAKAIKAPPAKEAA